MNKVLASIDKALAGLYDAAELESVKKALCLELLAIRNFPLRLKSCPSGNALNARFI